MNTEKNNSQDINISNVDFKTEEYLKKQAEYLLSCFPKEFEEPDNYLNYLLRHLEAMKVLCTRLELPWLKFIPVIHRGGLLCRSYTIGRETHTDILRYSNEMVTCAAFMADQNRLLHRMSLYYDTQIAALKKMIENN